MTSLRLMSFGLLALLALSSCSSSTSSSVSVPVVSISAPSQIAAGAHHGCALEADGGGVKCWGSTAYGQTGFSAAGVSRITLPVAVLDSATRVRLGHFHGCAIVGEQIGCWGWNNSGQLGDGTATTSSTAVVVAGLPATASDLALGRDHTCALLSDKTVACWGSNLYGQLGNSAVNHSQSADCTDRGSKCYSLGPVLVQTGAENTTLASVEAVVAGERHTCALLEDDTAYCWGDNTYGQLGSGTNGGLSGTATQVTGLTGAVTTIASGFRHACVSQADIPEVKCWGWNEAGQVGNGQLDMRAIQPVTVSGLTGAVSAFALGSRHSCGLLADGTVQCWGANDHGQLGIDSADRPVENALATTAVLRADDTALGSVSGMAAGSDHVCALSGAAMYCWGRNTYGQFGDGTVAGGNRALEARTF